MSKIKFFALGGLSENGKNMFVVEVDERIFILDAGLKYPSVDLYGIDAVIPDFSYLLENKERVQGIFLSHGHEDHIGAVPEVLKQLNIGVFGTHFTISILEDLLVDEGMTLSDYRLYRINDDKTLKFGNITVSFYNVSHSIPETINVAIKTEDGAIVYAPDFNFDVGQDERYRTSFHKICEVASHGVLALLAESIGTSNINRINHDYAMAYAINEILQTNNQRVIFSSFSTDLERIQKIINIAVDNNRRIAIIGRKAQKIVNIAINSGYLKIPNGKLVNLKYLDENNKNDDDDLVVIVTGTRHEPFYMLQRMCRKQDRLIEIERDDQVIIVTPPVPGTERMAAKTLDILYKQGAIVTNITKDMLKSSHADANDLKMLYSMLNPKYIIPIIGEYRHQHQQRNIAISAGYKDEDIILLENGEVATFIDGEYVKENERVSCGDVLVDGLLVGDINEVVLRDRGMMAQEGLVLISVVVDARSHRILSGPEIVTKGLIISDSIEEVNNLIMTVTDNVIYSYFQKKYIDWNALKNDIRDSVSKDLRKMTKKSPIIIPTVIDVEI